MDLVKELDRCSMHMVQRREGYDLWIDFYVTVDDAIEILKLLQDK